MSQSKRQFEILACSISGVEAVQAQSRHRFSRHMHDQFGVGVILQGAQKSLSGRGVVEAVAGDAITVNPGEVHDGAPIGDDGRAWKMLYFEPALVSSMVDEIGEGRAGQAEFADPVVRNTALATCVLRLFSCITAPEMSLEAMAPEELMLMLFATTIHQRTPLPSGLAMPSAMQAITHARSLMDDDPAAAITLSDLAEDSGLSRFQLIRAFNKATGMTPHAYLLQRRLHHARRLIASGMPLVNAAINSGFADQSHMTRLFVRNFGLSPGVYAGKSVRPPARPAPLI